MLGRGPVDTSASAKEKDVAHLKWLGMNSATAIHSPPGRFLHSPHV